MINDKAFVRICELFDEHGIDYHILNHPPCHTSAESLAARSQAGFPEAIGAKALLVKLERILKDSNRIIEFSTFVLPGPTKMASQALKVLFPDLKRFRFAMPEEMFERCGVVPGCMPPFASRVFPQLNNLYVDESLAKYEWVGFNAASLERSIVVRSQDYFRAADPTAILRFASPA